MSDLDDIFEGKEPAPQEPAPEPETQTDPEQLADQPSDQPAEQEAEKEAEQPQEQAEAPKVEQNVPLATFLELRDRAKAAENRARMLEQQAQPKAEVPDILEDQKAYDAHIERQLDQRIYDTKIEQSRFFAERDFGEDAVSEAEQFFGERPQLTQQFRSAPSPWHAAMDFYQAQKVSQEIGNDPAAYRQKVEAEVRAKIEAEMAAKQAQEMAGKAPPSMANVNGSGGQRNPGWQGPTALDSLLG